MNAYMENELKYIEKRFKITDLSSLNWAFRKLTAVDEKEKELRELASAEIARITGWLNSELAGLESTRNYMSVLVSEYATEQRELDPKFKAKTPYGAVSFKKQQPEWVYDADKVVSYLEENGHAELVRVKKEPAKAEIKKKFVVKNGIVVDTETGGIVPGIEVVEREDKLDIKVTSEEATAGK